MHSSFCFPLLAFVDVMAKIKGCLSCLAWLETLPQALLLAKSMGQVSSQPCLAGWLPPVLYGWVPQVRQYSKFVTTC